MPCMLKSVQDSNLGWAFKLMRGSCHLDRALNVEIGVECRNIFVVVFFSVAVKCIFGHLQGIEKIGLLTKRIPCLFIYQITVWVF